MSSDTFRLSAVAASVTSWVALTADAVILNVTDGFPAATSTDFGAFILVLLLESATVVRFGAAAVSETEQVVVAGPVRFCWAQETSFNLATDEGFDASTGSRVMTSVSVDPFALPVMVTLTDFVTGSAIALNSATVSPVSTTTEGGTFNATLLLVRETWVESVAGARR